MPAPPAAEELWPRGRFKGLGVVTRHKVLMRALSATGHRLRDGPRRNDNVITRRPPAIEAVTACAEVVRLIGRPELAAQGDTPWPDETAPAWIAIEEGSAMPLLRLGFRGALISSIGEGRMVNKTVRVYQEVDGEQVLRKLDVQWTAEAGVESERLYSFQALKDATDAARQALRAAGFTLAAYVSVEQLHGGQSAVAAIGLRSLSPARVRGPTMAR